MKNLRVVDQAGNRQDFETEFVPRIGERIVLVYKTVDEPLKEHHFRVRDVMYRLDNETENQAAILIAEDDSHQTWA